MTNEIKEKFPLLFSNYTFDFDGTLVDSTDYFRIELIKILEKYSISYDDDIIAITNHMGIDMLARYLCELGVNLSKEQISAELIGSLDAAYKNDVKIKPYVKKCLEYMYSLGMHLNVLTANTHCLLDDCLKRIEIFDLFDNIWTTEDLGLDKDNPLLFSNVSKKIGVDASEIVHVDDSLTVNKTAKSVGMTVVGVYDNSDSKKMEEMKNVSDLYIMDFKELMDNIKASEDIIKSI